MTVSGWGRYPKFTAKSKAPRNIDELRKAVRVGKAIAHGNGRSYGDSAISLSNTIYMKNFNRMLSFDEKTGCLVAEAGVQLADIIEGFLKLGWFPYVTPGTKFVTLGGMIAADIHGKNHHKDGSIANYIDWLDILVADGSIVRCSKSHNEELFSWTIGGMGLTGVIIRAAMRLRRVSSAWIEQRTLVAENIRQAMSIFEQSLQATYSVAWIDCMQRGESLGRSLVMLGEHLASSDVPSEYHESPYSSVVKAKIRIPFPFPSWILNSFSVRAFNAIYFWLGKRAPERKIVDWDTYFYPLDAILGWNKLYGRRGFIQFQCVIPLRHAEQGMIELLDVIAKARNGSFLAVLKRFGKQTSLFSFPMEGYTLALDFPVNTQTFELMKKLDEITLKYDGRFYLAKDSRMSQNTFHRSDTRAQEYLAYRKRIGASTTFTSAQSQRLKL